MLKFKKKPGVRYYPGTTIRIKDGAKAIRKISPETKKKWDKVREEVWELWGGLDALTLQPLLKNNWSCHHAFFTRTQSPKDKFNILNLCPIDSSVHNLHSGADELFENWKPIIRANARRLGIKTL
jgi:hypothetical protein